MSPDELANWLEDLYEHRNDVIHESVSYDDEIQVDRLADVAWLCVRWASSHLQPFHAFSDRPCESLEEVRECDRRAKAAVPPASS